MKRKKISYGGSKRLFTATAGSNHVNRRNLRPMDPRRGGDRF